MHTTQEHALVQRRGGHVPIAHTLLGAAAARLPVGGRIRAGMMVLRRGMADNAKAVAIYDAGVAAGRSFDDIDREICTSVPGTERPLVPKNVPFFTVRASDFPNGEIAGLILERYGEDRGDGRRLYRFPVVFPADAWQHVMPHELVTWGSSGKQYWSQYSADGTTRYCMTHAPVPTNRDGRRALRPFGGRKIVPRAERQGLCDPERCREYQSGQCNLSGRFVFYIPRVPSLGAFELPTRSFYAMQHAIERFQTIGFMRGGRVSGFLGPDRSTFWITKRRVEIGRIGDDGRPTRVAQWLIELEAPIDVTALLRSDDGAEALEVSRRADEAVAVLEGSLAQGSNSGEEIDAVSSSSERAATGDASRADANAMGVHDALGVGRQPSANSSDAPDRVKVKDLAWIYEGAHALGVTRERFDCYADRAWGKGWSATAAGRGRAIAEISASADGGDDLRRKVDAELDTA